MIWPRSFQKKPVPNRPLLPSAVTTICSTASDAVAEEADVATASTRPSSTCVSRRRMCSPATAVQFQQLVVGLVDRQGTAAFLLIDHIGRIHGKLTQIAAAGRRCGGTRLGRRQQPVRRYPCARINPDQASQRQSGDGRAGAAQRSAVHLPGEGDGRPAGKGKEQR